jgi:hypothetical protein
MSIKHYSCGVPLFLIFGIFIFTPGCWNSKDNASVAESPAADSVESNRITAEPDSPQSLPAKSDEPPQALLLTPSAQTEVTPPIQQDAIQSDMATTAPSAELSTSPIAIETSPRYGDQRPTKANEYDNPLRLADQPLALADILKPTEAPDQIAASEPAPKTDAPPAASITAETKVERPDYTKRLNKKITDVPFDPIKENGPIFVGWQEPKLALIITGPWEGYIEPCGCAGIDRMKGGMARRQTLFKMLRQKGWPVVALDVGGSAIGFGRQSEIKFQTMVEGMRKMGYDAIALGASDLRLPAGELAAVVAGVNDQQSPFVSANVALFGFDAGMTSTYRIIKAGGMRIGITSVLGNTYQKEIHNDELEMIDPEKAIVKILPKLKGQADYLVLLAHATRKESIALAKRFPEFNIVVTSDTPPEPPDRLHKIDGTNTLFIDAGRKGENAIVLGFYDDPKKPPRYQRVPLDSRFEAAPDMKRLMVAYQDQLKALGFAGLGLRPVPQPQLKTNGKFVGSKKCEPCHEESYKIWKKSLHSEAYKTLADLDPPRNFDPECISCHVMGWHPTRYFPYEGGYESQEKTPILIDVGCESCHGPNEKHVAAESGSNETLMEKYRLSVRLTKADSEKFFCASCHDGDNSPDYNFEQYWPLVEHYETSKPEPPSEE